MATGLERKLAAKSAAQTPASTPELATNPEIQAKIEQFKQKNPSYDQYLKALPRERLENIAVLRRIEQLEARERIQNATAQKLDNWLSTRPAIAKQIAERVATIAPEKQIGARINMIRSAIQQEAFQSAPKVSV